MTKDKWKKQLQTDFPDLLQITACTVHIHQQANQQRRDENP